MNAAEFRRWLKARGCSFVAHKGGSGHLTVYRQGRKSQLPMHGKNRELGTGQSGSRADEAQRFGPGA